MIGKYGDRSSGSTVMPFRLLESPPTLEKSPHFWRVGVVLRSPHTLEKSPYFWRVGVVLRSPPTLEKSPHSPKVGGLCVLFFKRDASNSGKGNANYPYCMNLGAFRCRVACSYA